MKIILTAINAKYIHSSLAIRSIGAFCEDFKDNIILKEFSINNDETYIISQLYELNADVICFSCYIWNIALIKRLIPIIKKLIKNVKIVLGGPEVSYEYEDTLKKFADIIIIGEGEKTFYELTDYFLNGGNLKNIDGIVFKTENGEIIKTNQRKALNLDEIPFAYKNGLDELKNKIIYYEASRGCPYNCQYCLSSTEKGVRFLSQERVIKDLSFFIEKKVKQVKFVDRTFNANKKFALCIWNFLIENDNGITNFHFEISADILTDDMIYTLKKARKGLFQLEIGIQSTNYNTLSAVKRKTNLDKLFGRIKEIKKYGNIHQHLDLIAGLPDESYQSFKKSFNDVFSLYPENLQLGFLKLLKGSGLRENADKYGIVYRDEPPYELLYTKDISFCEILRLKRMEEMIENYYNCSKCLYTIRFSEKYFESSFDFFEKLSLYWEKTGAHNISHSKMELYKIMYNFLCTAVKDKNKLRNVLRFDILMNDNLKNLPEWLEYTPNEEIKNEFFSNESMLNKFMPELKKYSTKQLIRICSLQKFDFDFTAWIKNGFEELKENSVFILFKYSSAGFNGAAQCFDINEA